MLLPISISSSPSSCLSWHLKSHVRFARRCRLNIAKQASDVSPPTVPAKSRFTGRFRSYLFPSKPSPWSSQQLHNHHNTRHLASQSGHTCLTKACSPVSNQLLPIHSSPVETKSCLYKKQLFFDKPSPLSSTTNPHPLITTTLHND